MKKIISAFIILLLIFSITSIQNSLSADLDYIDEYDITVDPNFDNGTLDIRIDIKWRVLDSFSEGPLSWVKIGIPNRYVDNITPLTNNIRKIKYYSDSGSFIRIDFNRDYEEGEIVNFSFKFNQARMYHLFNDIVVYDYNPGYFEEIRVGKCTLKWNKENVKEVEETTLEYSEDDNYFIWTSPLRHSEYIKVNLAYSKEVFNTLDPDAQYTNAYKTVWDKLFPALVFLFMVAFVVIVVIIDRKSKDDYQFDRGFVVYPRWHYYYFPYHHYHGNGVSKSGQRINIPTTSSSGGSHSSGGGCACACACACAGGGRAGCSIKDFYHTNLKSEKIFKALKK